MEKEREYAFETLAIHGAITPDEWEGSTLPPLYQSASHWHRTAKGLSDAFSGVSQDFIYMRLKNPTNSVLEQKLAILEGGRGAIATSSGMSAITISCMALLHEGDEFVSGNSLFMSTYLLFTSVFKKYGITAHLVDPTDTYRIKERINDKTKFLYIETIGNPKMDIPDIKRISSIAQENGIPLIVDNTLATPYLCRPIELGANVVIHSTTKYLSGHGNATGGIVIDGGNFPWDNGRFPEFEPFIERKGLELAFLDKAWREHHINFGTNQSPFHSYLTIIGIDTLSVRMQRHCENAIKVARFLKERKEVTWVNYPGFEDHPSYRTGKEQFGGKGFGGMLSFGLKDQRACFKFIDNLKLIKHLANLGDCKTLIIHPYSSQYISFDEDTKKELSIWPNLLRLSVGIESADDICWDIGQALDSLN